MFQNFWQDKLVQWLRQAMNTESFSVGPKQSRQQTEQRFVDSVDSVEARRGLEIPSGKLT